MKTESKQITFLTLIIIAFIFLAWQVYSLIRTDIGPSSIGVAKADSISTPSHPKRTKKLPQKQPPSPTIEKNIPKPKLTDQQKKYMELINKYHIAKMQRQLLEEEANIASAQQRIAVLTLQTKKLTGEKKLHQSFGTNDINETPKDDPYQLSYLDHQGNEWTATLYKNGHYREVTSGSKLDNGERVVSINEHGVVLQKGQKKFHLSFNGIAAIKPTQVAQKKAVKKRKTSSAFDYTPPSTRTNKLSGAGDFYNLSQTQNNSAKTLTKTIQKVNKPLLKETNTTKKLNTAKNKQPAKQAPRRMSLALNSPHRENHPNKIQSYTLDEILLLELPPSNYTIQLKSSYNKQALKQLAKLNDLGAKATYYSVTRDGKPWYTLLYDHFNTKQEAETQLKQLPEMLLQQNPKLQPISEVQFAIKTKK